jgi:predicted transposase/invertase (TIGR01784 family)
MTETTNFMKLKSDVIFKKVFSNINLLAGFLTGIVKIDEKELEKNISFLDTETRIKTDPNDKIGRMDLCFSINNKEKVNIEIQLFQDKYMFERTLFYLSALYGSEISKGESFGKLKKCIGIVLIDYDCEGAEDKLYTNYVFHDRISKEEDDRVFEIHIFNLRRLDNKEMVPRYLYNWLHLISCNNSKELERVNKSDKKIIEALKLVDSLGEDNVVKRQYRREFMARVEENSRREVEEETRRDAEEAKRALNEARKDLNESKADLKKTKSRLEEAENRLEETESKFKKAEIEKKNTLKQMALNMLKKNIDKETISEVTGLSIKEIEEL